MKPSVKAIYCLTFAFCAAVLVTFPRWTVDDAFISYRYAENLARHGELNWNPGSDPVEGYTGVALPLFIAGWIQMGGDPATGGRILGIGGYILLMLGFAAWLTRMKVGEPVRAAAVAGLACNPIIFTHATSGLETTLFLAAVVGCFAAMEKVVDDANPKSESQLWFFLLLASLVRPEGAALAVLAAGVLFVRARMSHWRGRILRMVACYVLPGMIYFLWRWNYYGRFLPNTFYAKEFDGILNMVTLKRMLEFAHTFLAAPLGVAVSVWVLARAQVRRPAISALMRPSPLSLFAALFFVGVLAVAYLRSELVMNYSFRFFTPFLPVAWGLSAWAVQTAIHRAGWAESRRLHPGALILSVAVLGFYALFLPGERVQADGYRLTLSHEHAVIGRRLAEIMPSDEFLACVVDAGAIPYFSRLRTYDFGKLNDEYLAQKGRTQKEFADYFFRKRPGVAVFTTRNWRRIDYLPISEAIARDSRFAEYELISRYRVPAGAPASTYYQFLFLRHDLRERLGIERLDPNGQTDTKANAENASVP